jgi:hypothetical protein
MKNREALRQFSESIYPVYRAKLFALPRSALIVSILSISLANFTLAQSIDALLIINDDTIAALPAVAPDPHADGYSPYDHAFLEPLFDQGRRRQESGEHSEALSDFNKAWQVSRINYGLYHDSQLALLDSMIECEIQLEDWEAVDKHYAYMEHLYRRLYNIDDARLEHGLQKISSWHISALNINLDGKRIEHLRKANSIFKLRLKVAELTLSADDPKFASLHRSIQFSERQLYRASDLSKEIVRVQRRVRRDRLLAGTD